MLLKFDLMIFPLTFNVRRLLLIFLFVLIGSVTAGPIIAEPITAEPITAEPITVTVVTENLPPMQIVDKDQGISGFATEIIEAMFKQAQVELKIEVLLWEQAYDLALTKKNVMIYSIVRSKERQSQFKWVGDILKQNYYFFALKNRDDIQISTINDVKKYLTGVVKNSFEHQLLLDYGFSSPQNLRFDKTPAGLIDQLNDQSIDLFLGTKVGVFGVNQYAAQGPVELIPLYKINEAPGNMSIAFSQKTDDKTVQHFQAAFLAICQDGTYDRILDKWLGPL